NELYNICSVLHSYVAPLYLQTTPKTKTSTSFYVSGNPTWKVPEKSKHKTPSQTLDYSIYRPKIAPILDGNRANGMKRSRRFAIVTPALALLSNSEKPLRKTCPIVLWSLLYMLLWPGVISNFLIKTALLLTWIELQSG